MTWFYWFGHCLFSSALKSFFRLEIVHPERRIEEGPAIIAVNHASFLDPPLTGISYRQPLHFLARSTLFAGLRTWIIPRLNGIAVARDQADLKSMKTILRTLRKGERLVMFPEGTRSPDGKLQPGKPGVGMLIAKSRVPVQPVRIVGAHEAWPKGRGVVWGSPIRVIIGEPLVFEPEEMAASPRDAYQAISDRVMAEIAKLE